MLHEVGLNINHSGMHRHSAYILQNSDLPGFNQEQQSMMATLVRLGVLLNNQRQATTTPPTLKLKTDDYHWTLSFPHDWFSQNALVLLDLEKEQQYWEAVTGWMLKIEEDSADVAA